MTSLVSRCRVIAAAATALLVAAVILAAGAITGPLRPGQVFVADTPCDENSAPATCPGPEFPPNLLGELNPFRGRITEVDVQGPAVEPQGMLFLRAGRG